jgi:hypothetical protein
MQQRFRKLGLFIGASALVGAGFIVAACGTDNGTTATPNPTVDGGGKDANKGDTSTTTDPDASVTDGSTVDCSKAPILRTNTAADGFFCAFYKPAEAGAPANCAASETCCNPGIADGGAFSGKFPPAYCAAGKLADDGCVAAAAAHGSEYQPGFFSNAWQCNDKTACAAGEVCVMFTSAFVKVPGTDKANVGVDTKAPAACHQYKAYKQGGSKCVAAAAVDKTTQVELCSMNDPGNCGAGTTCQPFDGSGRDLGSCR